jgi:hypothetical protein
MADLPPSSSSGEPSIGPDSKPSAGTPRWVYVFGAIALALVLLLVIMLLTGGGGHGPQRHSWSISPVSHSPLIGRPVHIGAPPAGARS